MVGSGKILSVFVSYSWDSDEHKTWVLRLAEVLQREHDIEVMLDQWDLHAGKDLTHYMERALQCERIVVVSTDEYVQKADRRTGGVGYESSLITAELVRDMTQDKFIPILRQGNRPPAFLQSKIRIDFRDSRDFDRAMSELLDAVRSKPSAVRPPKRNTAYESTTVRKVSAAFADKGEPHLILEGRFDRQSQSGRRQGLYIHNVGEGPAIQVRIEPIGNGDKWMSFGTVAVVRPNAEAEEVPIRYTDGDDLFRIGAYLAFIKEFRATSENSNKDTFSSRHPLRATYENRNGDRFKNDLFELCFHDSEPFVAANAFYEVERRTGGGVQD